MGLFDNLFGGGQAASAAGAPSGLFSISSKFATAPAAPQPAAAAAGKPTTAAGSSDTGGKKKKRKHEEQQQPASKPRQQQQQKHRQGSQAAEQTGAKRNKQQAKEQAAAAAAAAAAAVAATADAGAAEQQPKKKQKGVGAAPKQQDSSGTKPTKREQQPASTGAAAAAPSKPAKKEREKATGGKEAGSKGGKKAGAAAADDAGEDERLPRTVFVGNLPATVKRKALARLFAPCGAVDSVRLRSLPLKLGDPGSKEAKMPRRGAIASGNIDAEHSAHAYVVFKEEAAVEAALKLNMTEFEGHHLRVDRAAPKAAKGAVLFDHTRSLFVGNLPLDVEDEELIQLFGAEGVEAVRVVRDSRTGAGKGVAFVLFRSQDASRAALKQHRKGELRERQLRLTLVKKGEGGGKGGKAAWQQGQGGGGGGGKAGGGKAAGKRKPGGKRPAVAARKAGAKLQARAGAVQKR